jgi:hypothetical protein
MSGIAVQGRTIRLFLAEGTPTGIITADPLQMDTSRNPSRSTSGTPQAFDFAARGIPDREVFRGVQMVADMEALGQVFVGLDHPHHLGEGQIGDLTRVAPAAGRPG